MEEEKETELRLFQFEQYYGRMGSIEGIFIATQAEVDAVIGQTVHFGEALGKHSEIYGDIKEGEIEDIDIPFEVVKVLMDKIGMTLSGYNPLDHIQCDGCGATEEDCYCEDTCSDCRYSLDDCECDDE